MMVTSSTRPTRSMSSMCQPGPVELGTHRRQICHCLTDRLTRPGFFGNGDIWSVGGLDGATFQFLS